MNTMLLLLARWRIVLPAAVIAAALGWATVQGWRAERAIARATAAETQLEAHRAADAAEAAINAAEAERLRAASDRRDRLEELKDEASTDPDRDAPALSVRDAQRPNAIR